MPQVVFANRGKQVVVAAGTSVLDAAWLAQSTEVECCGIEPACGKCRMTVLEGEEHLESEPAELEAQTRAALRMLPFERLACMSIVSGDVVVEMEE